MPIVALIIDSSLLELSSELLLPKVFLKYSHRKRPKLTVILVMRRGQGCALRLRPLYNSDGKASLKRQRTPETKTDTKDVNKFY